MSYGSQFILTLFTNDPELARIADLAGVDRIGVDLECIGKETRQGHLTTWISDHSEADLARIRPVLEHARLFARCNPVHEGSREEIDRLIACGVEVIMLPFFKTVAEAEYFISLLDNRAYPVLLVETAEAAAVTAALCRIRGVREIHIGLNDMRLSLGWPSQFHVLVSGFLDRLAGQVINAGLKLGIGGLGRTGDNQLPIPSDLVAAQLARLGATASLVSRAFFRPPVPENMQEEFRKLRAYLDQCASMSAEWHEARRAELASLVNQRFGLTN
ncbi:MAG: hypothetical protein WA435_11440 [Gallionellaceae bacterium]